LMIWGKQDELSDNKSQEAFAHRAEMNSLARSGEAPI